MMKLCASIALLSLGLWEFVNDSSFYRSNPWDVCPKAFVAASEHGKDSPDELVRIQFNEHLQKYSCYNRSFLHSNYRVPSCSFNSIQQSMQLLNQYQHKSINPPNILFVGDSLTIQNAISLNCALEASNMSSQLQVSFRIDSMLRNDILCDEKCSENEEYFQEQRLRQCFSCADNRTKREYPKDYISDPSSWMNSITNETIAVVLGTGSWYNTHKHIMNHTSIYRDTLVKTRELIEEVVKRRKAVRILPPLQFYWMGLPPIIVSPMFDKYDWLSYQEKDHIAYEILGQEEHITFVNVSRLTREYKATNWQMSVDGLHWCNPGEYSIPYFLNRVLLHLIAVKTIPNQLQQNKKEKQHHKRHSAPVN